MKKGFTLIELVVVIAILAILATILLPLVSAYLNRANETADLANARLLQTAANIVSVQQDASINGIYQADASGNVPSLFAGYVGPGWPVPRSNDAKYFEVEITLSGNIAVCKVRRVNTDGFDTYDDISHSFVAN